MSILILALVLAAAVIPSEAVEVADVFEGIGKFVRSDPGGAVQCKPSGYCFVDSREDRVLRLLVDGQETFHLGTRVWVKGERRGQDLHLRFHEYLPKELEARDGAHAQGEEVEILMVRSTASCNHNKRVADPDRRRQLGVTVLFTNRSEEPREISLSRVALSTGKGQEEEEVSGLYLTDERRKPTGLTSFTLAPGGVRKAEFRGANLFKEGLHGKLLQIALEFTAGSESLALTGRATIGKAH